MTGKLIVFSIDVYALLNPGATLSYFTSLVANKFDIFPYILHEHFMVSTPVSELVVSKRVYRNCPTMLPNIVTYVKIYILDFDVIWVSIGCMLALPL